MSQLRIFAETNGAAPLKTVGNHAEIARELERVGVRFERWEASKAVVPGASQDEVRIGHLHRQILISASVRAQSLEVFLRHGHDFFPGLGGTGQDSDYTVEREDFVRQLPYLLEPALGDDPLAIGYIQAG